MMMYHDEREQSGMNLFILISLIIHAVIFMLYPLFISPSQIDGIGDGGVIQVIYTESGTGTQVSPISDPDSTTEAPQTEPPRPTEEPPKEIAVVVPTEQEVVEPELPRPKPVDKPQPEVIVEPEPKPEVVTEVPEPERSEVIQPQPQLETEVEPSPATSELITSEAGIDVVVDELVSDTIPVSEVIVEQDQLPEIVTPDPTTARPQTIDHEISGSGTSDLGSNSDGEDGIIESGTGEAEYSPPPPPPVPSGTSLIAGAGSIHYPKNAQDSGSEGTVILDVYVSSTGQITKVELIQSSGDSRLDNQARLEVPAEWELPGLELDYVITLNIDFTIATGVQVSPMEVR